MKKLFSLLLLPLLFSGCNRDDESRTETWTVASEKGVAGIAMSLGHVPACIVKRSPAAEWEIAPVAIEGFPFEKGYECVLRVRIDPIREMMCDGPTYRVTMEEMISRTAIQSSVDPLRFSPEFEIVVASQRGDNQMTAYWIKDVRYTDPQWQPFPWEVEGFDFTPGYECRMRIQPVAEYDPAKDHLIDHDSWTVKYHLKELISREARDSENLPIKAKKINI